MGMIDSKLINLKTTSITSHFVNGNEYSLVNEGNKKFYVKKSPDNIVNDSFNDVGNSLKGATDAARKELKKKYKQTPVVLCARSNIALIKCKSTHPLGCVWLVESKIKDISPDQNGHTVVLMKDGSTIRVAMNCKELQENREKASYLCKIFLDRSNFEDTTYPDSSHLPKTGVKRYKINPQPSPIK